MQAVWCVTPGDEVQGSIPTVVARYLPVGSMSVLDLVVFWQLPEFRQLQNWGIFLQKTYKKYSRWPRETVAGCEGRLPAYHRALFPPDLRFVNASTESRLSNNNCRKIGKNTKMNWNDDSLSVLCATMCGPLPCFQYRWRCFET